jgi:hypothetical protein
VTIKKRYYPDWTDQTYPSIVIVHPGDDDYDYAMPTLAAAKKSIVDALTRKITEARETISYVRTLRVDQLSRWTADDDE